MKCSNVLTEWQRVSREHPCPICEKPDWCLFFGPVDSPDAAICARIESHKRCGEAGWLHRLRHDDEWHDRPRKRRVKIDAPPDPAIDFDSMAPECESALEPHRRALLAAELGVTWESLSRLQVGWSQQHRAYSLPMKASHVGVRGIRLRSIDGRKFSVKGGREGLFLPNGVGPDCPFGGGGQLLICEGPTDTAALLDLDFNVLGRPSCSGGTGMIVDLVQDWHLDEVVVIADRDVPGQRGARYLASRLVGYVAEGVRIVTPPAKDAREWVRSGADRLDVLDAIDAAPAMTLTYSRRAVV